MLGRNEGWVKTQGEILADLFMSSGYPVRLTSVIPNRALRMTDIILSLIKWRKEIDIVNLSVFSGPGFVASDIASLVAKWLGKPLVFVLRGGNLPDFSMRHPQWVRRVFNRCDALVSPSGFLAHFFREWGFDVKVIPNVIPIENYPFRLRQGVQPNLLWMRTFHPLYHPEMAVEVLKLLREKYPHVCLTMAGQEKGLLDSVKSLAAQYDLLGSIRFAGFLETSGKQREFVAHDIYLHTNRIDNMPVSVVEAAAFGLPVVATKVGGISYLLEHERTALFVENGDVHGMANAVMRLIEEPGLCTKLSENGRKLAESCSWENVRPEWENLFEELLSIPKRKLYLARIKK
jgi:glycosyltransferase involved in cell wall biosynthesis